MFFALPFCSSSFSPYLQTVKCSSQNQLLNGCRALGQSTRRMCERVCCVCGSTCKSCELRNSSPVITPASALFMECRAATATIGRTKVSTMIRFFYRTSWQRRRFLSLFVARPIALPAWQEKNGAFSPSTQGLRAVLITGCVCVCVFLFMQT